MQYRLTKKNLQDQGLPLNGPSYSVPYPPLLILGVGISSRLTLLEPTAGPAPSLPAGQDVLGLLVLQPRPVPETDASEDEKSASCPASAIPCPDHKELHYPGTLRRATCSGVLRMRTTRPRPNTLPPLPISRP